MIDVIVPVLGRPHRVYPLVASLVASGADARITFVVSEHDTPTREALVHVDADFVVTSKISFPAKVNIGYQETSEPWLLLVGDDVAFHPGWDRAALEPIKHGAKLVSTNDLLNSEATLAGHAVHPLIARDWIDTSGASWDGPGTVAHEGYRHWFVDNEWSAKANDEGVFAWAPDAIIEHLHPRAGKAEQDRTYRVAHLARDMDADTWLTRAARHRRINR